MSSQTNENSWVNRNILDDSEHLKNLFWLYKTTNSEEVRKNYFEEKKNFTSKIRDMKKCYYDNVIKNSSNTNKASWKIVRDITNSNKKHNIDTLSILHNNEVINNPSKISNMFCEYFSTVAENLVNSQFPVNFNNCTVSNTSSQSMFFRDIEPYEIHEALRNITNRTSIGPDELNFNVINSCMHTIIQPLCYLFNLSFFSGIFPTNLKLGHVTPLHKKGDLDLIENYRAITQNSYISKIFEKIMQTRIYEYLTSFNLLSESQHGFRPKYSTLTAAYEFVQFIYESLDANKYVLGILFDLSRAFDCLNHKFLIQKIEALGIRGNLSKWIESFIIGRKIVVKLDNNWVKVKLHERHQSNF